MIFNLLIPFFSVIFKNMKTFLKKLQFLFLMVLFTGTVYAKSVFMYVSAQKISIKSKASLTSSDIGELNYGDKVSVVKTKGNWVLVETTDDQNVAGWINANAVTSKKINAAAKKVSTDANEITLAGKGFNSSIEAKYEDEYDLPFDKVDEIEENKISFDETVEFITEGKLFLEGERK